VIEKNFSQFPNTINFGNYTWNRKENFEEDMRALEKDVYFIHSEEQKINS